MVSIDPFANLSLGRAASLRWTLRDIQARRTKLMPVADGDLRHLIDLELIELRDDTGVGREAP
jgi:hypothetical protein